ncbi:MAG: MFS transporter [Thermomicrobiales bacterium]
MRHLLATWFRLDLLQGNGRFVAALALNAFGAGMFYPFALLYFTAATGLSAAQVGLVLTVATLTTLVVTPITGALVDRLGARRLVVLSKCLEATGFVLYIGVSSRTSLFVAVMLTTAGTRMYFTAISTLIADTASADHRDQWYGLVSVIQGIAGSISGAIAAIAIGHGGLGTFRIFVAGNAVCLLLCAWFYARHSAGGQRTIAKEQGSAPFAAILRNHAFIRIVLANSLFMLCSMMGSVGLVLYATEVLHAPLWSLGVIGAMQTAITIGGQSALLTRLRNVRRTRIMLGAGCAWAAAWGLYALGIRVPSRLIVPYLAAIAIVLCVAQMAYGPTARALAASTGSAATQGRTIALFELSWGLAAAGAPVTFGVLFDWHAAAPWAAMCGGVMLGIGLIRWSESALAIQANRPTASERTAPAEA